MKTLYHIYYTSVVPDVNASRATLNDDDGAAGPIQPVYGQTAAYIAASRTPHGESKFPRIRDLNRDYVFATRGGESRPHHQQQQPPSTPSTLCRSNNMCVYRAVQRLSLAKTSPKDNRITRRNQN